MEESVGKAIKALEELMDEDINNRQGKHVVMFRVFVGNKCIGGKAPFFLDSNAANNYYNYLAENLKRETLTIDNQATHSTIQLHGKQREWSA